MPGDAELNSDTDNPARHIARGDCERCRAGLIAQPVNAWSSMAYLGAGAVLAARTHRIRGAPLALAAVGAGSMAYHGPGGPWGQWLHDVSLASVPALAASRELASGPLGGALNGALVGAAGAMLRSRPGSANAVVATLGALAGVTALLRAPRRPARAQVVGAGLLLAGVGVHSATRTGMRWCRPDSHLQGHALWHVLSATGLALMAHGRSGV